PTRDLGRDAGGAEIPVVRVSDPRKERVWRRDSARGGSALRRGDGEGPQVAPRHALDLRHWPGTQPRGVGGHWPGTGAAGLPAPGPAEHRAGEIGCDEALFEKLRQLRKQLADQQAVPPYIIFSDVALRQMARFYPQSEADFARISGVGEKKLREFGG